MKRLSAKNIEINTNLKVQKVYPLINTKKEIEKLKTVGIQLNRKSVIELARMLLAVTQDWDTIDLTFYRKPLKNGAFKVTVTSQE